MLIVIQRVTTATIHVACSTVAEIGTGLMILCGFESGDTEQQIHKMLDKCLHYRIFADEHDKMNLSIQDIQGELLLVPQFTLMAQTTKGLRPGFSKAASPALGAELFATLINIAKEKYPHTQHGIFGADMQVHLCNDGPVTFLMQF